MGALHMGGGAAVGYRYCSRRADSLARPTWTSEDPSGRDGCCCMKLGGTEIGVNIGCLSCAYSDSGI